MNKLGSILRKDILLGTKNIFVIMEVATAVLIVLLLLFVFPKDLRSEPVIYIHDSSGMLEKTLNAKDPEEEEGTGYNFVDNKEAAIEGIVDNSLALGLVITKQPDAAYQIELLKQPYTSPNLVRDIENEMADLFHIITSSVGAYSPDVYEAVKLTSLQSGQRDALPFNKMVLPPILLMMVGILGIFAMVSLIGQERADLTIRAYRVTPAGLWQFIISKHLTILFTGFLSFSIIYLPMMGFAGYFSSLLIIVLTIIMGSAIGVILGSFFKNPMEAILWIFILLFILGLPAVSLFLPTFSPDWLKIIPSYHTLFALDASIFPDNNSHIIWQGVAVLAGICLFLFPLSAIIFKKVIGRET